MKIELEAKKRGEQWKAREHNFAAIDCILSPPPRYAAGIWKRSFIFTVMPTAHTNPSRKRMLFESTLQTGGI